MFWFCIGGERSVVDLEFLAGDGASFSQGLSGSGFSHQWLSCCWSHINPQAGGWDSIQGQTNLPVSEAMSPQN